MATQEAPTRTYHPLAYMLARAISDRANEFAPEHGLRTGQDFDEIGEESRDHLTHVADQLLRDLHIEQAPEEGEYLMRLQVPTMKVGEQLRYACCNRSPDQGHADNCSVEEQKKAIAAALVRANIVGDWTLARPVDPLLPFRQTPDDTDRRFVERVLERHPTIDPHDDEEHLVHLLAPYAGLLRAAASLAVRDQHDAIWRGNRIEGVADRPDRIPVEEMTEQERAAYRLGREEAVPGKDVEELMRRFRESVAEQAGPDAVQADHLMWCYAFGWADAMKERTGYEDPNAYVLPEDARLQPRAAFPAEVMNDLVTVEPITGHHLPTQPRDGETITVHGLSPLARTQQFVFSDGKAMRPLTDGITVLIRPTLLGTAQALAEAINRCPGLGINARVSPYEEGHEVQFVPTTRPIHSPTETGRTDATQPNRSNGPSDGYEYVDHPHHYNRHPSGVECIDIIEHFPFNVGAAMKHLWRVGLKPGENPQRDLKKAVWYAEREAERLQGEAR